MEIEILIGELTVRAKLIIEKIIIFLFFSLTLSLCSFPQLFGAFSDAVPVCARSKWHHRRKMAALVPKLHWQHNKMGTWWHLFSSLHYRRCQCLCVWVLESILTVTICCLFLPLLCFDICVAPWSKKKNMHLSSVPWTRTKSRMKCSCTEGTSDSWGQWGGVVISQGGGAPLTCVLAVQVFRRRGSLSKDLHANWCYWIHLSVMCFRKLKI